jgi:hypothetical protein
MDAVMKYLQVNGYCCEGGDADLENSATPQKATE